ncbi:hypothetical protein PY092_09990 [Muricauda sp. 334s03]|uniref:Outer membrane protein beta-barrel domain-containing protein n=1 Tax=Flagellimonas yonaguniensis TaxID=3031325 RepID=A0ABT5XZ54_9FLAO|nr:hypothetical protein [[Muricauda] yonaguniensis]MDF0716479.1 hypothetical protein [[Muricauda] yonaguniensis]
MALTISKIRWLTLSFFFFVAIASAQTVDLETLGKGKAFELGGGVSTNGVFYNSNQEQGRQPFTYFLQGNLNISFYQFSMPISYSYSNQGEQLNYNLPFNLNRLSLHPKYKWIQGHIGDVSMSFSPHTLNGHQFTGGGVELTPNGPWRLNAMAGRLLKATEFNGDEQTIPAFQRMGYGLKVGYEQEKYTVGVIAFYAKDDMNSIGVAPDEQGVTPKENMVLSLEGAYKILENLQVNAAYATSGMTQDLRANELTDGQGNLAGLFLNDRISTEYFDAFRAGLDYSFDKSTLGLAYERIAPGYETLGAYFFNNDFENITLNTGTVLFENKLNLAFNVGYQRDDLENQKERSMNRTVGSLNATYNASEVLTITGSYSNFTTFTNAKVNQFEVINDDNLLDDQYDALNYRQLSQNANVNINYILSKREDLQQNLNINYALADVSNAEDGVVRIGNASTFHNGNVSYTMGMPNRNMNITTALNGTLNTVGAENSSTWGPTLNINNKFLENTLNTNFGASYNTSNSGMAKTSVTNLRANLSYVLKEKHNFHLNVIQLFKSLSTGNRIELTITFGHSYSF